ncbi:MAG: hypothetical protein FWE90_10290 [Defluviitaleaceae bacterium]|nr:hypothetical protein [Defluviitaleaceae bacterium]
MKTSGYSYIEVLIAVALFAIALAAILPTVYQSGRNMAYAHDGYQAHLHAQNLMLAVRGELETGVPSTALTRAETVAHAYASERDGVSFTVWLIDGEGGYIFRSPCAPDADADIIGDSTTRHNRTVIVVAVWNGNSNVAARAIGFV